MKNTKNVRWCILALAICSTIFVTACTSGPDAKEVAAKYTEQTARAIIEGSWKIAGAIVFAAVIRGLMNK